MKKAKKYTGINIQWPISELILSGKKSIETRTYPIPPDYIGKELALIETPGKSGKFKARIVGIITFSDCFKYSNKAEFYNDSPKHFVTPNSKWAWLDKAKWGWRIDRVVPLQAPKPYLGRKGIVFTKNIKV
ncbi:MAG: hypothetical protein IPJ71_10565 [Bdellovibrionales bacterium]|nr:hypothetical protein [Bdellovibrionales bacterium]